MRYAIVDTDKAEAKGLKTKYHITNNTRSKMAVNENELLKIESDPATAARQLDGELLEYEHFMSKLNKWDE